jgi:predicted dehydrogenase
MTCLVDPDAAFLVGKAQELGIERTATDLAEVLDDPAIDGVTICSPHPLHCEQAIAAAEAGKHVLVEKPMAMDVDEATRMIDAARAAGVCLYVAESATYQPIAPFLRDVVQSGRWIGELTAARVTAGFRAPAYGYPARRSWLAEPDKGGLGTWTLHGIHTVAQLRYVLGEVAIVRATQHRAASFERDDVEATVAVDLTLVSGVTVQLLQTAETKIPADLAGYTLFGDQGCLQASGDRARVYTADDAGRCVDIPAAEAPEHALELAAFAAAVRGTPGPTDGPSERRSLAVVQAGYESMASGQAIDLAERFGPL